MASAGVVGMAEVVTPTSAPRQSLSGSPAMWAFAWTAAAALFLVMINMALIGRGSR